MSVYGWNVAGVRNVAACKNVGEAITRWCSGAATKFVELQSFFAILHCGVNLYRLSGEAGRGDCFA
jgi:hypothetical protein